MLYELSPEEIETIATFDKLANFWSENEGGLTSDEDNFWYDWWRQDIPEQGRVLDLGCSTGREANLVLSEGLYYVGTDLSEEMLTIAKRKFAEQVSAGRVEFLCMNMCELEFPPESFDAFRACDSFKHIPKANLPIALREAYRVLKTNGVGFIATCEGTFNDMYMFRSGEPDGGRVLFVEYTKEELEDVLKSIGFNVIWIAHYARMLLCIVQKSPSM